MPRKKKSHGKSTAKIDGKWYGRVRARKPDGTAKTYYTRQCRTKSEARTETDALERKFLADGRESVEAETLTFAQLAERYLETKVVEAVYIGERKVAGMKHPDQVRRRVRQIAEYFGPSLVQQITYADLEAYKLHLVNKPTRTGGQRSIYDVNHHLRHLRAILNFALRNRWLRENPFHLGDPLVNAADELPRDRGQSPGEFQRLLDACYGRRAHLRVLVLLGMDTALRPAEILRLKSSQIHLEEKLIVATATTTKTNREREVPISNRLAAALRDWLDAGLREWLYYSPAHGQVDHEELLNNPAATIFGNIKSVKVAWASACQEAGIKDLKFKDLRHWATTDMVEAGARAQVSDKHIMKITGHTQEKTFRRYLTTNRTTVERVGAALEAMREQEQKTEEKGKLIH